MPQYKFKSCFYPEIIQPDKVILFNELNETIILNGVLYVYLTPYLIKGDHSADELVDLLAEKFSPAEVYYALMRLEKKGWIKEKNDVLSREISVFCDLLKIDFNTAEDRLKRNSLSIKNLGNLSLQPLMDILKLNSIQLNEFDSEPKSDHQLVITDDYSNPNLVSLNFDALKYKRQWLLAKPVGAEIWIGPLFHPDQTGCWECLAQRLRNNRAVETFVREKNGNKRAIHSNYSTLPSNVACAWNLIATEVFKWIVRSESPELHGKLISFNALSMKMEAHTLVRNPNCRCCGNKSRSIVSVPSAFMLQEQMIDSDQEGGYRCLSPEETLKKYEHQISPITGIVNYLSSFDENDNFNANANCNGFNRSPLHVYYSGYHKALSNFNEKISFKHFRHNSAGKGKTNAQAKVGALCESIERHSGAFQGDEIFRKGTFVSLNKEGIPAIHPNSCMLFSDDQYKNREVLNHTGSNFHFIPRRFDENVEIDWTPIWSLSQQKHKYIPTRYCYYQSAIDSDSVFCKGDSNGNAAGNTIEEAIFQGFLELVERDCVALWWYNRLLKPLVDLSSFKEPYFNTLISYYKNALNRDLWVLDITSDLGIPSFVALSKQNEDKHEKILYGFGSHFNAKFAIQRALTEVNQAVSYLIPSKHEKMHPNEEKAEMECFDSHFTNWLKTATVKSEPYLLPNERVTPKQSCDFPLLGSFEMKSNVLLCQNIVENAGMEMLFLDQTRADIGMPVVKVIVPGLVHFWPRFAPGRLYNIPVQMGWLKKPLKEAEFNPIPILL